MAYALRILLYSVAVVTVGAGIGVLLLRQPLCEKSARRWSIDIVALAVEVEAFKTHTGAYPVAFSGKSLKAVLGKSSQRWGPVDEGLLEYWSDGQSYIASLTSFGPGPVSSNSLLFEIRNGDWYRWPECLTEDVRQWGRSRIQAARATAVGVRQSNHGVIAPVRPVTPLANGASGAPVRPARYALR